MRLENKTLGQKNQELIHAFSEKSKAHQRIQRLYQRAKGTQDAQQMQHAAADDVDHVIQSMHGSGFMESIRDRIPQRPANAHVRGGSQELPQVYSHGRIGSFGGSSKNQSWAIQSPRGGGMPPASGMRQATPNCLPLGGLDRNITSGQDFGGYGSSGGVRVGGPIKRPASVVNRNLTRVLQ